MRRSRNRTCGAPLEVRTYRAGEYRRAATRDKHTRRWHTRSEGVLADSTRCGQQDPVSADTGVQQECHERRDWDAAARLGCPSYVESRRRGRAAVMFALIVAFTLLALVLPAAVSDKWQFTLACRGTQFCVRRKGARAVFELDLRSWRHGRASKGCSARCVPLAKHTSSHPRLSKANIETATVSNPYPPGPTALAQGARST